MVPIDRYVRSHQVPAVDGRIQGSLTIAEMVTIIAVPTVQDTVMTAMGSRFAKGFIKTLLSAIRAAANTRPRSRIIDKSPLTVALKIIAIPVTAIIAPMRFRRCRVSKRCKTAKNKVNRGAKEKIIWCRLAGVRSKPQYIIGKAKPIPRAPCKVETRSAFPRGSEVERIATKSQRIAVVDPNLKAAPQNVGNSS